MPNSIKPSNFPLKVTIDGSEEIYTQTGGVNEKFYVDDVITRALNLVDAEDVDVIDSAGNFTGSTVEEVLAELQDNINQIMIESLSQTLSAGNTTGGNNIVMTSGDLITSSVSSSQIELNGLAGGFELTSDSGGFTQGYVYGNTNEAYIGFGDGAIAFSSTNAILSFGSDAVATTVSDDGVGVYTTFPVNYKGLLSSDNSTFTGAARTIGVTGANALFLNSGSNSDNTTFNQSVDNSVAIGGVGLTVKTNNTAYANQLSFQEAGNTFDIIVAPSTATADRTQTLQDASGTIALISDIVTENLQDTLTAGNTTGGNNIIMTEGDDIIFKYAGFNNNINTLPLTTNRSINFPDNDGVVALTTDITSNEYDTTVNLVALTPLTVTHSLGTNKLHIECWDSTGKRITQGLTIIQTSVNALTIESNSSLSNVDVYISGHFA